MTSYQAVPIPEALVPTVVCLVADWLEEQGEVGDPSDRRIGAASWAEFAGTDDPNDVYGWLENWLRPKEGEILRALAEAPGHRLTAPELADRLGITSSSLAGIVGPFSRRLRRDGYPTAIESRLLSASDGSRRRIKYMSISDDLAEMIAACWPSSLPTAKKTTLRAKKIRRLP